MKPIVALLLALLPASSQAPFGSPACPGEPADRVFFFTCHSPAHKTPLWVAHTLTPEQLEGGASRPSRFRQDRGLASPSAADRDYRFSGFHRGHLAPAADFSSPEAVRATFLLSNAVPQKPSANTGPWRRLENAVRRAARTADRVHVFTGALFEGEPRTIGAGQVAVPSHTYKVILLIHGDSAAAMFAAIVPNHENVSGSLDQFTVTVDEVEQRTGLDFFSELDDALENDLESRRGFHGLPDILQPFNNARHFFFIGRGHIFEESRLPGWRPVGPNSNHKSEDKHDQ
jgi:endonuclease G